MNNIERYIGVRIRTRRIQLGLTQGELARRMNISYQQIQKYEAGVNRIALSRVLELAHGLDTSLNYFVEGIDQFFDKEPSSVTVPALPNDACSLGMVRSPVVQKAIDRLIQAVRAKEAPSGDYNA